MLHFLTHPISLLNLPFLHLIPILVVVPNALLSSRDTDGWHAVDYPNPQIDYVACGMDKPSWICDPDGVLIKRDREKINQQIKELHNSALGTCPSSCGDCVDKPGVYVSVAVTNRINKQTFLRFIEKSDHASAKAFAKALSEEYWNFGVTVGNMNECQNTLVVLVVAHDTFVEMYAGDQVRYHFELGDVVSQCRRKFKRDYSLGIRSCVRAYWSRLRAQHYQGGEKSGDKMWILYGLLIMVAVALTVILGIAIGKKFMKS